MVNDQSNLEDAFKRIDDLVAKGRLGDATVALFDLRSRHFFEESVHERLGNHVWMMAERCVESGKHQTAHLISNRWAERASAGLYWYLSDKDDEIHQKWRERAIEEFSRDPENLFKALRFPEIPFGRFTDRSVNARLDELRVRLGERGYDNEKLKPLLEKPRNRRLRDRLAMLGCAFFSLAIIIVFVTGVFTIKEWFSSHHLGK